MKKVIVTGLLLISTVTVLKPGSENPIDQLTKHLPLSKRGTAALAGGVAAEETARRLFPNNNKARSKRDLGYKAGQVATVVGATVAGSSCPNNVVKGLSSVTSLVGLGTMYVLGQKKSVKPSVDNSETNKA